MCKMKDKLLSHEQIKQQYYGEFMEWVYDTLVKATLTTSDIDKMEEEYKSYSSSNLKNKILSNSTNNVNYKNFNLGA